MADAYSFGVVLEVVNGMMTVDFRWPEALLIKKGAAEETAVAGDCVHLLGKEFITKEERTLNSVIIILVAFRDGKLTMLLQPPGRAIQVETGFGERLPSIDTRPPRTRDTDAIIEIQSRIQLIIIVHQSNLKRICKEKSLKVYMIPKDCFGRPISSPPDAWIDVVERYSNDNNKTLHRTSNSTKCINLGSYNYLGFAAADEYCAPRVIESLKKYSPSTCSVRVDGGRQ